MRKTFAALILLTIWTTKPSLANPFYTIDSPSDAYTGSSNSYEIYNVSHTSHGNRIRLVVDTDVPLRGHRELGAADHHVGHTDIRVQSNNTTYGIKFAPNENPAANGIYRNPNQASVVKQNFGRDAGDAITKLSGGELVTNDVHVEEFAGAGHNGSNRIVIDFPADAFGDELLYHLTVECGNDSVDLFIPAPIGEIDIPINIEVPGIEPTYPDVPSDEDDDGSGIFWKVAIPVGILALILVFMSSGGGDGSDDSSTTPPTDNPPNPPKDPPTDNPPKDPPKPPEPPKPPKPPLKVPEPKATIALIAFLAMLMATQRKNK